MCPCSRSINSGELKHIRCVCVCVYVCVRVCVQCLHLEWGMFAMNAAYGTLTSQFKRS